MPRIFPRPATTFVLGKCIGHHLRNLEVQRGAAHQHHELNIPDIAGGADPGQGPDRVGDEHLLLGLLPDEPDLPPCSSHPPGEQLALL